MPSTPKSVKVKDELGQEKSLPQGVKYFKKIKSGQIPLLLGLGPNLKEIKNLFPLSKKIFILEHPHLCPASPPKELTFLTLNQINLDLLKVAEIWLYRPSLRAFPSFFGPLLATLDSLNLKGQTNSQLVWLLANQQGLLTLELTFSFKKLGFEVKLISSEDPKEYQRLLNQEKPYLVLSLNAQGLDKWGQVQFLLQSQKIPLFCWLVDNPFNILTKFKGHFFILLPLFITDPFFIPHLKKIGLEKVFFLPLASTPSFFAGSTPLPSYKSELLFVGRSIFPGHTKYFAGLKADSKIIKKGETLIKKNSRPDLTWLTDKYPLNLKNSRYLSYQAQQLGLLYRKYWLEEVSKKVELKIVGDLFWQKYVNLPLLPAVDYYTQLKNVYKSAQAILNLTSFLLPFSLNQRHFDVWLSEGFLLTDYTLGLNIFPSYLREAITFQSKKELFLKLNKINKDPTLKKEVQEAFKKEILEKHTYLNRVSHILNLSELFIA